MKKCFIYMFGLLLVFLLVSQVQAFSLIGDRPATACTTANDSAIVDYAALGADDGQAFKTAQQVILSGTYTITEYQSYMCYGGPPTATFTMSLYTDNSNTIGTEISGSDKDLPHTSITTCGSPTLTTFTLDTPLTGQTGTLWVVMDATDLSVGTGGLKLSTPNNWAFWGNTVYTQAHTVPVKVMGCAE